MKITEIRYTEKIFGLRDGPAPWNNELPWRDAINSACDVLPFQAFEILTDEGISGLSTIYEGDRSIVYNKRISILLKRVKLHSISN
jgi:hypothetical protein